MKNKVVLFIFLIIITLSITSCNDGTIKIVHASDLHYMSHSLIEDDDFLWEVTEFGDGKDILHSSDITSVFVSDMLKMKPDVVVLTGDLTLNGEKKSNEELREKLSVLKENGIKVLVITGNHDVNRKAYRYTDVGVEEVESLSSQEFEDLWYDYGYGDALYHDDWSNSYVYSINEKLWLLAIDSNTGMKGIIRGTTLNWIETVLKEAKEKNIRVISLTHQNLFVHNSLFTWGYQLDNAQKLIDLFKEYDVHLNLSGHLHVQTIKEEDGITDIAVSSLSVTPLQYGILTIDDNKLTYKTKSISSEQLKNEAKLLFDTCTKNKIERDFSDSLSEEERTMFTSIAVKLNREYFEGKINPLSEEELNALKNSSMGFFSSYLVNIYSPDVDNRNWQSKSQ